MLRTVGFLHTSPVHQRTFEALVTELDPHAATVTTVDELLLASATEAEVDVHLNALLERGADVIICTCSTIGGLAEQAGAELDIPVVRVDRPMVEQAVSTGRRLGIVAALESTIGPTTDLIDSIAAHHRASPRISVHLIAEAWPLFDAGDVDGYVRMIADACTSLADRVDVIVLAQASMAAAVDLVDSPIPVLTSPRLAVEWAVTTGLTPAAGSEAAPGV